jgi:hypothetical protein
LIDEDASLAKIEEETFAECLSLRSFEIPMNVEEIGRDCFSKCVRLSRLRFCSGESLKKIVGGLTLVEAVKQIGFDEISNEFKIEVNHSGMTVDFPLLNDANSHL